MGILGDPRPDERRTRPPGARPGEPAGGRPNSGAREGADRSCGPGLLPGRPDARGRDLLRRAIEARYGFRPPTLETLELTFSGRALTSIGPFKRWLPLSVTLRVKFPFSASGKAKAAGSPDGFIKLIFDAKYGELLGAHMIGANVTEMIAEIVAIRKLETTGHELIKTVHPHPTMSEAIMEAAAAAYGEVIHL